MGEIRRGDMVDTPYGPGIVLESHREDPYYLLTIDVRGSEFKVKCVGVIAIGHVELPT